MNDLQIAHLEDDIYQVVEGDSVLFQGTIANCLAYIQAKNLLLL